MHANRIGNVEPGHRHPIVVNAVISADAGCTRRDQGQYSLLNGMCLPIAIKAVSVPERYIPFFTRLNRVDDKRFSYSH